MQLKVGRLESPWYINMTFCPVCRDEFPLTYFTTGFRKRLTDLMVFSFIEKVTPSHIMQKADHKLRHDKDYIDIKLATMGIDP